MPGVSLRRNGTTEEIWINMQMEGSADRILAVYLATIQAFQTITFESIKEGKYK